MEEWLSTRRSDEAWRLASFFRPEGRGIRCTLCPHGCLLNADDHGLCGVRRRHGDQLETATFSAVVVHLDAIERKPLYHFAPGRRVLTIGGPGCSLSCDYCQNYRLSQIGQSRELAWRGLSLDPDRVVAWADEHDALIGFSYSEPSLAIELTLAIHERTERPLVWKTNGFMTAACREAAAPTLAAVNVDLKAPDEERHRRLTGGALKPVLESVQHFVDQEVWVEVSSPVIPGFNADEESIRRMADLVLRAGEDVPWHLLRFVPDFRLRDSRPTRPDELEAAAGVARAAGVRHVYVERALGAGGRNTHCHVCGVVVIARDVWQLTHNGLVDGCCGECGTRIAGRW